MRCPPRATLTGVEARTEAAHEPAAIDPRVDVGHVHLKVADIERALAFYCDVLGFELQQRYGDQAAFVSAGGYHHHIGLNTWESKGGSPPPRGTTGLYHVAIRYPDRRTLADALSRLGKRASPSMVPPTTASRRPSTCETPTGMTQSRVLTVRR
jgi:catechol-2,3-dioxygenase